LIAPCLAGLVLAAAACGGSVPATGSPGASEGKGASPASAGIWPLRGTKAPDASAVTQRPLVVKVANDPSSRPQTGLLTADLIIEIPVEGSITRLAVVFHSQDPARVGPVRSARQSDLNYLATLNGVLVHVGASDAVAKLVRDAASSGAFVDIDEFQFPQAFERTTDKPAPYNTYTSGAKVRAAAGEKGRGRVDVPALPFDGSINGDASKSDAAVASFTVQYALESQRTTYEYDGSGGYRRTQGGGKTTDGGTDVLPQNVVIVKTDVSEIAGTADAAGSPSVDYRATGTGPVLVFRDGKRFEGTWSRQGAEMYKLADAAGATIALRPGLTWLHIVPMSLDIK
jgi:hypothetical protein